MARRQFVLDQKADRLLNRLSRNGVGSYSAIVRRGIELVQQEEAALDALERDPEFLKMMEASEKAFREGRWTSHEDVMRIARARRRKAS